MDGSQVLDIPVVSPPMLGDYRIVAEIGRGGMADVYLALPSASEQNVPVVIKKLRSDVLDDDDFRAMFYDEARLARKLRHPNIVQTLDVGDDGDACFIVMEFLDGQPLSRIRGHARRSGAAIPLSIHLRVLREVLTGLQYVHELADHEGIPLGVVHRDITPQNIFVTYDGQVKVVDFGIAKARARQVETRIGVIKGKLSYIAPENVRRGQVDRRSDLFSVGVMLWEAATGRRFWQGLDELEIYQRLAADELPTESGARDMPPQLFAIVEQALAPNPHHRFASAAQMRAALAALPQLAASSAAVSGYLYQLFVEERRSFHGRMAEEIDRLDSGQWPIELPRIGPDRLPSSTPTLEAKEVRDDPGASHDSVAPVSLRTSATERTAFSPASPTPTAVTVPQVLAPILVSFAAAATVLAVWMVIRDTPPKPGGPSLLVSAALSLDPIATSFPLPAPPTVIEPSGAPVQSSVPEPPKQSRPLPAYVKPSGKKVEPSKNNPEVGRAAKHWRRLEVNDPWTK